jgi:hypothetical protein
MTPQRQPLEQCQRRLLATWYLGVAPTFVVLLGQTFFGFYGEKAGDAWSWLLPAVMPTLLLVMGTVKAAAKQSATTEQTVDRYYFRLAFTFSVAYLLILNAVLFTVPFSPLPLEHLRQSNFFIGPFQGLVGGALGAVFASRS